MYLILYYKFSIFDKFWNVKNGMDILKNGWDRGNIILADFFSQHALVSKLFYKNINPKS